MAKKFSPARREAFFRALGETGNQTIAAERARVSRSWVRLHRTSDPGFCARMDLALDEAKRRLNGAAGVSPGQGWGSLDGEELLVRGCTGRRVQIARARLNQWTPRVETRFLNALAATCNVTAACAEVGLSPASAYYHANRWADFAERWRKAIEEGYFRVELQLMERATNGMSPQPEPVDAQGMAHIERASAAISEEEAFKRLSMHRHALKGVGKPQGRKAKWRPEAREEMMRVLVKGIERMERSRQAVDMLSTEARERDRREWTRRGAT